MSYSPPVSSCIILSQLPRARVPYLVSDSNTETL
jgi:hypothetical protein